MTRSQFNRNATSTTKAFECDSCALATSKSLPISFQAALKAPLHAEPQRRDAGPHHPADFITVDARKDGPAAELDTESFMPSGTRHALTRRLLRRG